MKIVKKFTQPKFCTQKKRKLRQLQIFNAKLTTKMPTISQFGLIGEKWNDLFNYFSCCVMIVQLRCEISIVYWEFHTQIFEQPAPNINSDSHITQIHIWLRFSFQPNGHQFSPNLAKLNLPTVQRLSTSSTIFPCLLSSVVPPGHTSASSYTWYLLRTWRAALVQIFLHGVIFFQLKHPNLIFYIQL